MTNYKDIYIGYEQHEEFDYLRNLVFCLIIMIVLLCKRDECLYCKSSSLSHYYDCVIVYIVV